MFFVDYVILYGSTLVLAAVLSRKFASRFGVPVLVLFVFLGMLAGSEGIGGIEFEDYRLSHAFGTIALVVILFDGGLGTHRRQIQLAWRPSLVLATLGVLLTALITGLLASWLIGISILQGLLLGSIVASTDAAAVFSILRSQGVSLEERLKSMLEIESGSNDPMAVFLTIGFIEVLLGERHFGIGFLWFFLQQMGIGLAVGYGIGRASTYLINRIHLDAAGLYPVMVLAVAFLAYGVAVLGNGSGFLAVYVAGIVLGNSAMVFRRGTVLFHDGLAWACQISMFVILGLLSFPSALIDVTWQGLGIAVGLMFVARPIAVFLSLLPFQFSLREVAFTSWVGLKGAVPIILGIFPLLFGLPQGYAYFNIVFFVVLVSALTQGWSLPFAAKALGLRQPQKRTPPATLEITSLGAVNADIVEYEVVDSSAAAHMRISELNLPEDIVIAMVTHGSEIIPARGPTVLLPGDHVFAILRPSQRQHLDTVFAPGTTRPTPLRAGILVPSTMTVSQLNELYGLEVDGEPQESLEAVLRRQLSTPFREGSFVETGGVLLFVHSSDEESGIVIGVDPIE